MDAVNESDFRIILFDNIEIEISKTFLISKLKYFKILHSEGLLNENSITLDENPNVIRIIFSIIQNNNLSGVNVDNLYDIIVTMDKFLIEYNLDFLFHIKSNIRQLIINLINLDKDNNKILTLYDIFTILRKLHYYTSYRENIVVDIIRQITQTVNDKTQNIFIFKDWPLLYSPCSILYSIEKYKRYDLLNTVNVSIGTTLKLLQKNFKISDKHREILSQISKHCRYFSPTINNAYVPPFHNNKNYVLTSYYPDVEYFEIYSIFVNILHVTNNIITFNTNLFDSIIDDINTSIIFNYRFSVNEYTHNKFSIVNYVKEEISTSCLTKYKITLDKDLSDVNFYPEVFSVANISIPKVYSDMAIPNPPKLNKLLIVKKYSISLNAI
jgi:hypothetical protein